jgi:glycosyltransferase involved in cell wall biosynthesis
VRILYVMGKAPLPADSGDAHRNWALLQAARSVATRLDLIALPHPDVPGVAEGRAELERLCDRASFVAEPIGDLLGSPAHRALTVAGRPYFHGVGNRPDIRRAIRRHTTDTDYDLVVLSQLYLASALPDELLPRTVYDTHNVHHLRLAESLERTRLLPGPLRARVLDRVREQEARLMDRVAATVACSDTDAAALRAMSPDARIETIANGVDLPDGLTARPAADHRAAARPLFLASLDASANVEGLQWLVDEVLPVLRADVRIDVAGSNARPAVHRVLERAGDRVHYLGQVPDARATMRAAAALLVPLLTGGGTRLKVLEAFAVGLPVVSTAKGVEGIPVRDGVHARVADHPAGFAAALTDVLDAPDRGAQLAVAARELVAGGYGWDHLGARFIQLLHEVGAGRRSGQRVR